MNTLFVRNFLSFASSQFVTVLISLIQIPLFIKIWGLNSYGEWVVLAGVPQLLVYLDLGLSSSFSTFIIAAASKNNFNKALDFLQTLKVFSAFIGSLAFLIIFASTFCINWTSVLKLSTITSSQANLVLILMAAWFSLNLQYSSVDAKLQASGRTALSAFIISLGRFLEFAITCLILINQGDAVNVAFGFLVAGLITRIVHIYYGIKCANIYLGSKGSFRKDLIFQSLKPALGYFGISAAQALLLQGSTQILNQISSKQAVAIFTFARTAARFIFSFGFVVNYASRAILTKHLAQQEEMAAKVFFERIILFSMCLGFLFFISFIVFFPFLYQYLTHSTLALNKTHLFLIGLPAFLGLFWYVHINYYMATNRHSILGFIYITSSALAFFLVFNPFLNDPILKTASILLFPELIMSLTIFYLFYLRKKFSL